MTTVARLNDIGIKQGDIVRIKWKSLEEIVSFYKTEGYAPSEILQQASLDDQLTAIMNDGHYLVESVTSGDSSRNLPQTKILRRAQENQKPDEVTINNHNNFNGGEFTFNINFIDDISVEHDAGKIYFSDKFNMSILKIDGGLFINGQMLTKRDGDLIDILEETISDMAIQRMLDESTKEG